MVQVEVSDPDIAKFIGEFCQPRMTIKVSGCEEEVDGVVGVVPGRALQTAELQRTEVGPTTRLHQPYNIMDLLNLLALLALLTLSSYLSQNLSLLGLLTTNYKLNIPSSARLAGRSGSREYTDLELDLLWLHRRRNDKLRREINIFNIPYFLMFDNILNYYTDCNCFDSQELV